MNYNYHTHTHRCGHAEGTDEEYIQNAIERGIRHMGFSDHIPVKLPNPDSLDFHIYEEKISSYVKDMVALRDKYKNKIDIKIGFEAEYSREHFRDVRDVCRKYNIDYLICGQHFIENEQLEYIYSIFENDNISDLKTYVSTVLSAMKEGAYTYIAHPDMFNFVGDPSVYDEEMRKICICSRVLNVPIELNFLGIRGKRNYPNDNFWRIAGEENSPVVYGLDAHSPVDSFDEKSLGSSAEIIQKFNLNIQSVEDIINRMEKIHF